MSGSLGGPASEASRTGGGSDDIGDVAWSGPTITLRFPSNIPGTPGHNWEPARNANRVDGLVSCN